MAANPDSQGPPCSAVETVWPKTELIPQLILQHLNLRDVWNLRRTNKTMNVLLQGRSRPLNPNTTLSFVGAHCDEIRRASLGGKSRRCTNGPLADVLMKYCENTSKHGNIPMNVCEDCINHNNRLRRREENRIINSLWLSVCETCQTEEEDAFPEGRNTCICRAQIRGGWKCDRCCRRVMREKDDIMPYYHDQFGHVTCYMIRPWHECRCGRQCLDAQAEQQLVLMCLGCKGVIVAPSNKGKVIKRSERIRKRRLEVEEGQRKRQR